MIKLDKVTKKFGTGVFGLSEITLAVDKGEFVFLVGPTGSGKTTILRLLIRDILPTEGSIIVGEYDIVKLPNKKIPHFRKKIGIVFQDLKLLLDRTIVENIVLPLELAGFKPAEAKKKAEEIINQVGLLDHRNKFPIQLSGGEIQRTAIARALVLEPEIILADEPTGNLDPKTGKEIVDILLEINKKGTTIIMATHNVEIVNSLTKRVVTLEKGKLIRDERKGKYEVS
ncbi:MAG: ATP-binding cassette domain-containing protein [Candidatus Levybacteria bacterium]|nr:ATP-binding cassette domain-containing protein [Candidatus Levybacteria bacterium]